MQGIFHNSFSKLNIEQCLNFLPNENKKTSVIPRATDPYGLKWKFGQKRQLVFVLGVFWKAVWVFEVVNTA